MIAAELASLRRWLAATAIVAVLGVVGLGAADWLVHAHHDHGWHAHAGQLVPTSPESPSEGLGDDDHEHGVAATSLDLIAKLPTANRLTTPHPSELPAVAARESPEQYVAPSLAPPSCAVERWHPPPLVFADSGTSRVLRTSHALLF